MGVGEQENGSAGQPQHPLELSVVSLERPVCLHVFLSHSHLSAPGVT